MLIAPSPLRQGRGFTLSFTRFATFCFLLSDAPFRAGYRVA